MTGVCVCVECGMCGMQEEEGVLRWPAHSGWINMERKESGRSEREREITMATKDCPSPYCSSFDLWRISDSFTDQWRNIVVDSRGEFQCFSTCCLQAVSALHS